METRNRCSLWKLRDKGLKVGWAKEMRRMKNEFKRDLHHPSWQMAVQRHIDAAHALVQLANEDPSLLQNEAMPHPAQRKFKKMKMFKSLSSLRPDSMEIDVNKNYDSSYEACDLMDGCELSNKSGNNGLEPTEFFQDRATVEVASVKIPTKMQGFKLAFPTVDTGFSFSVIHLLTSVRRAMVAPHAEDDATVHGNDQEESNSEDSLANLKTLPCLTLDDVVQRVRSTRMDPSILRIQQPLHDLVRGVLNIFSSNKAPLGAKGWKPLTFYHKSTKCWSWIGPYTFKEEEASPDAWNLHHSVLVKLVDSFAIWLKSFQESLHQIESLPAPPLILTQPTLEEESKRFKDVTLRKCTNTIIPSSEEVRAYFHKEEALRYAVADRVFFYTALDGRKSAVAPIINKKRGLQNHVILKAHRPPHVTVLCLVRDAAARLPGSIGTRADISTLLRDSRYVVEEVSDEQLGYFVSGALDRLHYEYDPCVKFDRRRKLWVYLHGRRSEEEFDDDGTLSTLKRPTRKEDRKDLHVIC